VTHSLWSERDCSFHVQLGNRCEACGSTQWPFRVDDVLRCWFATAIPKEALSGALFCHSEDRLVTSTLCFHIGGPARFPLSSTEVRYVRRCHRRLVVRTFFIAYRFLDDGVDDSTILQEMQRPAGAGRSCDETWNEPETTHQ